MRWMVLGLLLWFLTSLAWNNAERVWGFDIFDRIRPLLVSERSAVLVKVTQDRERSNGNSNMC